jgi:hypothetical protein
MSSSQQETYQRRIARTSHQPWPPVPCSRDGTEAAFRGNVTDDLRSEQMEGAKRLRSLGDHPSCVAHEGGRQILLS